MIAGLFVTGTDTGVGKTRIAAAIVRNLVEAGRRVGAMKPVATSAEPGTDGILIAEDTRILRAALGGYPDPHQITPLVYPGDVAPCVAARLAGQTLMHAEVMGTTLAGLELWARTSEVVVVEGVGGLLCPLADDSTILDLALSLDFPVVIVARRGLGTINHTLMTVETARRYGLRVAGVVLNGSEPTTNPTAEATNPGELARRLCGTSLVADVGFSQHPEAPDPVILGVNWWEMARLPRLAWTLPPAGPPRS